MKSQSGRFPALRIISAIYKVLGAVVLLLTFIVIIIQLSLLAQGAGPNLPFMVGATGALIVILGVLISGGMSGLTLYAFGELIDLLMALEENTRAMRQQQAGPPAIEQPGQQQWLK